MDKMKKSLLALLLLPAAALSARAGDGLGVGTAGCEGFEPTTFKFQTLAARPDSVHAQSGLHALAAKAESKLTFGGYIMSRYSINDRRGQTSNGGFDIRFLRLYANGYVFRDFYYRFQLEACGQPGVDKGPRIMDAFVEWQHWDELRVKMGQFKRSWGFENPYSPIDLGLGAYSQITQQFAFNDRCGEHSTSGRDIGVQLQGDLFAVGSDRHKLLHYQVGVFNGQGINHSDKNRHKDVIGGLWFMPVKDLAVGAFGWNGKFENESYTGAPGTQKSVRRVRWGVGLKYEKDWTVRAEYASSVGGSVKDVNAPEHSDGWYVAVGAPIDKKFKVYGRWDSYRDARTWESLRTDWGLSANYRLNKNLIFQLNYTFTDDRNPSADSHYNTFDAQITARF